MNLSQTPLLLGAARNVVVTLLLLASSACLTPLKGQTPTTPVYFITTGDFITGDSQFSSGGTQHWSVDPGADIYSIDQYERPTNASYGLNSGIYSTNSDYFGNLDIVSGSVGFDANFLYVKIDMFDAALHTAGGAVINEGLKYNYRFRFSTNADGSGGFMLGTDSPGTEGTAYHLVKNYGFQDTNGDFTIDGNGYETPIIADGKLTSNNANVLYARINPSDPSIVEFALNYGALGLTQSSTLPFFVWEANKGLLDNQNYRWNMEYTGSEAGSPNGGGGGLSEFGTQGLGNIYELDTVANGPEVTILLVPEPGSALLISVAGVLAILRRRRGILAPLPA